MDLAFRKSAILFMEKIERLELPEVTIDFSGVLTINRSFAHEYNKMKSESIKRINEINVPENIQKMLSITSFNNKHKLFDLDSIEVKEMSSLLL